MVSFSRLSLFATVVYHATVSGKKSPLRKNMLLNLVAKSAAGTAVVTQPQNLIQQLQQTPAPLATTTTIDDKPVVTVRYYGESGCPDCADFVVSKLGNIITAEDLMQFVDFDSVAFGNSYFGTDKCGSGPDFSGEQAMCWIKNCLLDLDDPNSNGPKSTSSSEFLASRSTTMEPQQLPPIQILKPTKRSAPPDWCFDGPVFAQHGALEELFDIYQSCAENIEPTPPAPHVDPGYSRNAYVFQWCSDGEIASLPDKSIDSAPKILAKCAKSAGYDNQELMDCSKYFGHTFEVMNAKLTPKHDGVPFIVVDGKGVGDPADTLTSICNALRKKMKHAGDMPKTCLQEEGEKKDLGETMVV